MKTDKLNVQKRFFSRKNDVSLVEQDGRYYIRKIYKDFEAANRERECYSLLLKKSVKIPIPIYQGPKELHLTYIKGITALELLEWQETTNTNDMTKWHKLAMWCCDFYQKSGLVLGDPNLRNFIMEINNGYWFGIDFECSKIGSPSQDFAELLAFLLCYCPENTSLKRQISAEMRSIFSKEMKFDKRELEKLQNIAIKNLLHRRTGRSLPDEI